MKEIKRGNFTIQVKAPPHSDLYTLLHGFNDMVTTLKHAQKDLEAKTKEMNLIVQHIKPAMLLINRFGRIIMCNNAAEKLLHQGFSIKHPLHKKIPLHDRKLHKQLISLVRKLYGGKKRHIIQETIITINDESRTFMIQLTSITLNRGLNIHQKGLLVSLEDLTQIVKDSKLKTWQEAAKQMAHEIKNPLTPIQLSTQRLQRKYQHLFHEDAVFMECTTMILNQVTIIKNLARHFSAFASMPTPQIEEVNLHDIIQETVTLYRLSYPDIVFHMRLTSHYSTIKSDKKKLQRVFINLFDNSIRALQSIHTTKTITIKTLQAKKPGFITVVIHDNGPGIPAAVKNTLFLPYVSTEQKNMGLGLAIVHDTIIQLGGSIELISTTGGATFQILLPL
jgi:two-component system nitrogen regulation sensor histidine kinase NtrY